MLIALENYDNVTDALNKELILMECCTNDIKQKFKEDIKKIRSWIFDDPNKANGSTSSLRSGHAKQLVERIGIEQRGYAHDLLDRITSALDEKGWLDQVMRNVPTNLPIPQPASVPQAP